MPWVRGHKWLAMGGEMGYGQGGQGKSPGFLCYPCAYYFAF